MGIIDQSTFPADVTLNVDIVILQYSKQIVLVHKNCSNHIYVCTNLHCYLIYSLLVSCIDRLVHRKGRCTSL